MATDTPRPLARQRNLILAVLLGLAITAWVLLIQQSMGRHEPMGLTMGMSAPVFVLFWGVMMVAMMFPAAAPMILMFARVEGNKRAQEQAYVPTWIFAGGYLLVWTLSGLLAWAAAARLEAAAQKAMWVLGPSGPIRGPFPLFG